MKCERCGKAGSDVLGECCLCDECTVAGLNKMVTVATPLRLALIVREWMVKRAEFGELAS